MIELMWIGVTTVVLGLIIVVYFMSSYNAPRIDALYTDTERHAFSKMSLTVAVYSKHTRTLPQALGAPATDL